MTIIKEEKMSRRLLRFGHDEIHHWRRVHWTDGKVALALPQDHREISTECLVILLRHPRVPVQHGSRLPHTCRIGSPALASGSSLSAKMAISLLARHDAAQGGILPA